MASSPQGFRCAEMVCCQGWQATRAAAAPLVDRVASPLHAGRKGAVEVVPFGSLGLARLPSLFFFIAEPGRPEVMHQSAGTEYGRPDGGALAGNTRDLIWLKYHKG